MTRAGADGQQGQAPDRQGNRQGDDDLVSLFVQGVAKNHSTPGRDQISNCDGRVHVQDVFVLWNTSPQPGKVQGLQVSFMQEDNGQRRERSKKHSPEELYGE